MGPGVLLVAPLVFGVAYGSGAAPCPSKTGADQRSGDGVDADRRVDDGAV